MELLTVKDLMTWLKMSKSKVYELTQEETRTGSIRKHPLPYLKIDGSVRFRKSDVEAWIEKLVGHS